jgi:hypothetical protein
MDITYRLAFSSTTLNLEIYLRVNQHCHIACVYPQRKKDVDFSDIYVYIYLPI